MRWEGRPEGPEMPLAAKVAFLGSSGAYADGGKVVIRETHMSWVFITGDTVYKLKKPVRASYLDFSTLPRREAACRAEFAVNGQLAPQVYLGVVPLTLAAEGLSIGGAGAIVDWLVLMRRLAEDRMLDRALLGGPIDRSTLDRLADVLSEFYRHATPVLTAPEILLGRWRTRLAENRSILVNPALGLRFPQFDRIDRTQRRFLAQCAPALFERAAGRRIVDGHGDLRPEHIFLGEPLAVIDRLEFDARLRAVDPLDEIESLAVECTQLGQRAVGEYLVERVGRRLHDPIPPVSPPSTAATARHSAPALPSPISLMPRSATRRNGRTSRRATSPWR